MTSWQRIEKILEYTHHNTNSFAKSVRLKRSENLYQIKRGNNGISKELSRLITEKYPEISSLWLLTGEGDMFVDSEITPECVQIPQNCTTKIPYYDLDLLSVASKAKGIFPSSHYEIPIIGTCDFAIKYSSDKMSPKIEAGSIVFVKEVDKRLILFGEIYLILTKSYATIRYIEESTQRSKQLKLLTTNRENEVTIDKSDIDALFIVKGVFRAIF